MRQCIINPSDTFQKRKDLPDRYILIYYPELLNYFKRKYKPKKIFMYRLLTIYQHKNIGVVMMTGVGAPNAVMVMEQLIALGGKQFINVGTAGGLTYCDFVLCDKSLRDEGTSQHYDNSGALYSYPNQILTNKLYNELQKSQFDFCVGTSWTTDAPYRETFDEINKFKSENVLCVEMESSALFTVAQFRKVKIASAFVISDYLSGKKWLPKFHTDKVKTNLKRLVELALNTLRRKKQ